MKHLKKFNINIDPLKPHRLIWQEGIESGESETGSIKKDVKEILPTMDFINKSKEMCDQTKTEGENFKNRICRIEKEYKKNQYREESEYTGGNSDADMDSDSDSDSDSDIENKKSEELDENEILEYRRYKKFIDDLAKVVPECKNAENTMKRLEILDKVLREDIGEILAKFENCVSYDIVMPEPDKFKDEYSPIIYFDYANGSQEEFDLAFTPKLPRIKIQPKEIKEEAAPINENQSFDDPDKPESSIQDKMSEYTQKVWDILGKNEYIMTPGENESGYNYEPGSWLDKIFSGYEYEDDYYENDNNWFDNMLAKIEEWDWEWDIEDTGDGAEQGPGGIIGGNLEGSPEVKNEEKIRTKLKEIAPALSKKKELINKIIKPLSEIVNIWMESDINENGNIIYPDGGLNRMKKAMENYKKILKKHLGEVKDQKIIEEEIKAINKEFNLNRIK